MGNKVRVLVVDDSALVRSILSEGLSDDVDIEVIGTARDPYEARDILVRERPDVITLDIEMPKMDGLTFLKHYMRIIPTPTVVVSALTDAAAIMTVEALEAGAVDVVAKPRVGVVDELPRLIGELAQKVKAAARARLPRREAPSGSRPAVAPVVQRALASSTDKVIAIGCSAGGTQALARLLPSLPPTVPGIAIVQHMPAGFTASLARRLDTLCAIEGRVPNDGDRLRPGLALIAAGGELHMAVMRSGGHYLVRLRPGSKVDGHCPSVNVLFDSVASHVARNAIAVLLTGMGKDGAQGLLAIRNSGGRTFVQDAASSVVWGMPGEAWHLGAAESQVSLDQIPLALLRTIALQNPNDSVGRGD